MEDFTKFAERIDTTQERYENTQESDTTWLQKLKLRFEKMGGLTEFFKLKEILGQSLECTRTKDGFSYCDKHGVEMYSINGEFLSHRDICMLSADNVVLDEIRRTKEAKEYLFIKDPSISLVDGTCFVGELDILAIDMNNNFDFFSAKKIDTSPAMSFYTTNCSLVVLDFNPNTVVKFYTLVHELGHIYSYAKNIKDHTFLNDGTLGSVMYREHLANEFGFDQVRTVFYDHVDESSLQLLKAYQEAHYAELLIGKVK